MKNFYQVSCVANNMGATGLWSVDSALFTDKDDCAERAHELARYEAENIRKYKSSCTIKRKDDEISKGWICECEDGSYWWFYTRMCSLVK